MSYDQNIRKYIVQLAMKLQGIPYLWGGSNPNKGFDCSGFVIWCYQVFGLLPQDYTARMLHDMSTIVEVPEDGDLAFYGEKDEAGKITRVTHVMMCVGHNMCIGATGGDSTTTTLEEAERRNAKVKIKNIFYRGDFLCFGSLLS